MAAARQTGNFPGLAASGYTLIEVVVTMSIIAALAVATFGVIGFQRSAQFDSDVQTTLAALRDLQSNARTVEGNQEYGMSFAAHSWTSFSRNPVTGVETTIKTQNLGPATLSASVTPTAGEVVFARLTGRPINDTQATLTFTMSAPGKSRAIQIDSSGVVYAR